MTTFRVGQMVKVIGGPRAGEVTTVTGQLCRVDFIHTPTGELGYGEMYPIDLLPSNGFMQVVAKPEWLEPFHDPSDHASLESLMREIRSAGVKERA